MGGIGGSKGGGLEGGGIGDGRRGGGKDGGGIGGGEYRLAGDTGGGDGGNAGGGNQLRQPYLKNIIKIKNFNNFKNVEKVHFFGYYIGNYPKLNKNKILQITKILNSISL